MKHGKKPVFFNLLMTVIFFLFLMTMSVSLVIYFRPLYYIMLKILRVPEESGYSYEVCRRNYNILIDYNLLWGAKKLELQDFEMSIRGAIHFAEVKRIFAIIQITSWVTLLLTGIGCGISRKKQTWKWLKYTIVFTVLVVAVVGGALIFDWDGTFVLMHHILFDNDYWLFDPATDPIITVLPDEFFLACGTVILVFMTVGLVISGIVYRNHYAPKEAAAKAGNGKKSKKSGKKRKK